MLQALKKTGIQKKRILRTMQSRQAMQIFSRQRLRKIRSRKQRKRRLKTEVKKAMLTMESSRSVQTA